MEASGLVVVSWRGQKIEVPLRRGTTVGSLKSKLAKLIDESLHMTAGDVKIFHKGKPLSGDKTDLYDVFVTREGKCIKTVRLMAIGASDAEIKARDRALQEGIRTAPRIRDDITDSGKADLEKRREAGRKVLAKAAARAKAAEGSHEYGFGSIETLPGLTEEAKAREILSSLANDPGILACMAKHKWNVSCLAEMYPKGNVGQDEVCVMGLNHNKGQKILLRLRTDDLKGFRKVLSVRKVLFHELAHNVHSEHDGDFYLLMRQIEKDCNEMDWTQGSGSTVGDALSHEEDEGFRTTHVSFDGGSFRLGGDTERLAQTTTARDLAARAAMLRSTAKRDEMQMKCVFGKSDCDESMNSKPK